MPYIKSEPDEFDTLSNGYGNFNSNQNFGNFPQSFSGSIDPSELSMGNGHFNQNYNFGGQNMSGSFHMGGGGAFNDDEILESLNSPQDFSGMQQNGGHSMSMNQGQMNGMYSNTPDGAPIQSPFTAGFDYSQFRPLGSIPQHMSPHQGGTYMNKRPSMQAQHRKSSAEQRNPMTPRTAGMAGLHIGTPESGSLQQNGQAIRAPNSGSRHQKSMSGQFDGTPSSMHSFLESPLSSPSNVTHHAGISQTISSKHASLPNKVEHSHSSETQEAKKRRRRASHNAVERRRRDNINERIQDLSMLVPQHRLDDDKIRKQLASNSPLSPSMGATSMSPPNAATSLLAGASGRRAASTAGNITLGLPIEEKEKGPNKGDILNGSVAWTRDLMWALYNKYVQEDELANYINQLGGQWPFQVSEDDKRMRTEVMDAIEKNDPSSFSYTRHDGSGLRVPKHTTLSGERIQNQNGNSLSPSSNLELSPGFHSGGSGTNSGSNPAQPQFWHSAGHAGMSFKEEDEFMELNS
ncbi:hypothetical protein OHC33_002839 [Knufia fluminis]|uniref:BHLH domain-containing protein n=1 Tax=Knufia fluminis TaxID=191047 RepID=A0AAN8F455_9EURO|nr:hypothetical protein OHC33_002839 [Knufia fluminis]